MSTIVTRSGKGSPLTHAEVDSNFTNLNTDKLELSGGTLTGTLNFGDNVKAQFGASADLQIVHDGNNSYISDVGSGSLFIQGSEVKFRHGGSQKLETTSSGINVTGTVSADEAVYVQGSTPRVQIQDTDGTSQFSLLQQQGSDFFIRSRNNTADGGIIFAGYGGASTTNRMYIAPSGDISFYEDTGTTAKFFWDASAESLGIGTTSPATAMHVNQAFNATDASAPSAILSDGSYGGGIALDDQAQSGWYAQTAGTVLKTYVGRTVGIDTAQSKVVMSQYANGNMELYDDTHSSAKLTWDATAEALEFGDNVKATFGASSDLQIYHDGSNSYISENSTGNLLIQGTHIYLKKGDGSENYIDCVANAGVTLRYDNAAKLATTANGIQVTGSVDFGNWTITESGGSLYFATGGTNKMKLDASGNLDVVGSVNANATIT